jgi:acyl-CoA synthetase (AMP-forming)/AMP-acid ligase II
VTDDYRLPDEPRRHRRERGDRPALTAGQRTMTYAELDRRTNRVGQALRAEGVKSGGRVAVLDRSSIEVIEVLLGAAKIGAVTVPLNCRLTAHELSGVLEDAGASVMIAHEEFAPMASSVRSSLTGAGRLVLIGRDYEQWVGSQEPVDPGHRGDIDDIVLQLYTSGTTGNPKGVLGTNRNLGSCTASGGPWGFDESSVSLCAMPMFHIGGLGWALVGLANGAHNVIERDVTPSGVLETIERLRITNMFLVPSVIGMLVDQPGAATRDYSALRSIAYGASPITPALLRRALETFGRPLFQVYGMTETHGAITQLDAVDHDPGGPREHLLVTAGRPYPWVELKIIRLGTAGPSDVDEPGEICVRSPQNTPGYYRKPEETAATIDAEGWLHTGDIGSIDAEGYLTIKDRLKDMIITGGENVYPAEVEAILAEHPDIASVAVVGQPNDRWGELVTAVVVPRPGATIEPAQLIAFAKSRLASYKCPKAVEIVDSLPLGSTGKVLKRELRRWRDSPRAY